MIKKIFVGVLLAGIFALLVLGAVNRTIAKSTGNEPLALSENLGERSGGGNGNQGKNTENSGSSGDCTSGDHGSSLASSVGNGRRADTLDAPTDGQGYRGGYDDSQPAGGNNGQGGQPAGAHEDGSAVGIAVVEEWLTFNGVVDSVADDLWVINLADAGLVEIEGRLLSFLQENGFSVSAGDEVVLRGFMEGDHFETGRIENVTAGTALVVREESGRPLWAGGRRGGANP